MTSDNNLDKKSVEQLIRLYDSDAGVDDAVGPELTRRGAAARDKLIRTLDALPASALNDRKTVTVMEALSLRFPCRESLEAMERYIDRLPDQGQAYFYIVQATTLRAELNGKGGGSWQKELSALPPSEQQLYHVDMLVASARPSERVIVMSDAAWIALNHGSEVKAKFYANEILATADPTAQNPDGTYTAHHVLGTLALRRGDVNDAKRHLIDAGKTTGSWSLENLGPNWALAEELLRRGEWEAVSEFLDNCKVFSKRDDLIESWKTAIRAGETPKFRDDWHAWANRQHRKRKREEKKSKTTPIDLNGDSHE